MSLSEKSTVSSNTELDEMIVMLTAKLHNNTAINAIVVKFIFVWQIEQQVLNRIPNAAKFDTQLNRSYLHLCKRSVKQSTTKIRQNTQIWAAHAYLESE